MVIGFATNNEAKLMAIKQGLTIAIWENYQRVLVEGDSAMTTGILQKLQQGSHWDKISQSWCTARLIQEIGQLLRQIGYVIPKHVRRGGNEAADCLANWSCKNEGQQLDINQRHQAWNVELQSLQIILEKDQEQPRSGCHEGSGGSRSVPRRCAHLKVHHV